MKWSGYRALDDFWINHFVATGRTFFGEWNAQEQVTSRPGPPRWIPSVSASTCVGFLVWTGSNPASKLRLRLPLPLSQSSEQVEIEPIAPAGLSARVVRSEGRLDFQFSAPSEPIVEIAAKIAFTTDGRSRDDLPGRLPSDRRETYLRANEGLIRVTPRIHALAGAIGETGAADLRDRDELFPLHYRRTHVRLGALRPS